MLMTIRAYRMPGAKVGVIWSDTSLKPSNVYKVYNSTPDNKSYMLVATVYGSTSIECEDNFERSYYMVESGTESIEVLCENNGDYFTQAISTDNLWYLENVIGSVKAKAFLVRKDERKCPSCYNEVLKKRTTDDCSDCFGTGHLNALSGPLNIRLAIVSKTEQKLDIGVAEKKNELIQAWTSSYCYFMAGDCIVIGVDKYVIQEIPSEVSHYIEDGSLYVSKQYFTLKRIDKNYMKGIDESLWTM